MEVKKKQHKKRNPMAYIMLATDFFKSKIIPNKKKYKRSRDKKKIDFEN